MFTQNLGIRCSCVVEQAVFALEWMIKRRKKLKMEEKGRQIESESEKKRVRKKEGE